MQRIAFIGKDVSMKRDVDVRKKILLSGVFGPFGVDDEFGRKENIMELFHNQVTREQGVASFRFQHRSFGLYFIAENVDADVTVLDFPSLRRFEAELRKGYDIVGISFIAPNFVKAREMARRVRELSPGTILVLGGHGAAIDGLEDLIDADHIVKGEGIRWMREFLGQDPEAPIVHPALPSGERHLIYGIPVPGRSASVLVPGVGCVNGCRFCCTSHFFGKSYTPFLSTGREIFESACRIADLRGTNEFFVLDENFLKDKARALELVEEMERHQRFFEFHIFSSAEAVTSFGLDNLERLGATFVWIGVESSSKLGNYPKNEGIDPKALIREMRDRGIIVLASGILCQEHHTPENIDVDIDFMVGLEADFVQFMLLTPLPTTTLYREHEAAGLLRKDLPFEEWHGQKYLSYRHPAFAEDEPEQWLKRAFRRDYETNSSSMYRVLETQWRGYRRLQARGDLDVCLSARRESLLARVRRWSIVLGSISAQAVNGLERERAEQLAREIASVVRPSYLDRGAGWAARLLSSAWKLRISALGDGLQPATLRTRYPAARPRGARAAASSPPPKRIRVARPNLGLTRPLVVLALGVLLPVLLSSSVGIVALALGESSKDVVLGVLAVSFAAASIGGAVVLTVLLGRRAHAARLQSDLLGNVSHELKTPLSAIRLYAQTLQSGLVDADPSSARACADAIARETEWLGAMIDRLLTWRGVARDREDLAMETGPLTDVVDEVASRFARMLPPGEVEFTTQVSTSLPVRHDRSAISSILLNLLTNAYKYTGSPKRISMCVEDGEGEVVLSVRDNGIGIPEREHKRIFQPFHRVDSELAGRAGGAGLGLAIAGVLVRGHHGSIVVDSEVGRGSTFKVSLPVAGGPH